MVSQKFSGTRPWKISGSFFERFRRLNIRSSPELDALLEEAQQVITGIEPQQLRDSVRSWTSRTMWSDRRIVPLPPKMPGNIYTKAFDGLRTRRAIGL